jgi:hypothetical protein
VNSSEYFLLMTFLFFLVNVGARMSDLRFVRFCLLMLGVCLIFSIAPVIDDIKADDTAEGMKFFGVLICMFAPLVGLKAIYTAFISDNKLRESLKDLGPL